MEGQAKVLSGRPARGWGGDGADKGQWGARVPARPGSSTPLWPTRPLEQHPEGPVPQLSPGPRLPQQPSLEPPKMAHL